MSSRHPIATQLVGSAIVSIPLLAISAGAASADPGPEAPPKGMPMVVDNVLQPSNPDFWNPGAEGTRVLTPLEDSDQVACSAGFTPPISCSTLNMSDLSSPQRVLEHVDIPTLGGPIRVCIDVPRWGDGSTGELNERIVSNFA